MGPFIDFKVLKCKGGRLTSITTYKWHAPQYPFKCMLSLTHTQERWQNIPGKRFSILVLGWWIIQMVLKSGGVLHCAWGWLPGLVLWSWSIFQTPEPCLSPPSFSPAPSTALFLGHSSSEVRRWRMGAVKGHGGREGVSLH